MTASLQIAFITGRSQPDCGVLSPVQRAFLAQVAGEGHLQISYNFPWQPSPEQPHRSPGLLRASLNNSRDYLASRRAGFARRHRQAAIDFLANADRTVLLAGSCGLELFNNLHLPSASLARVSIFAYGPVARRRPDCRHLLVQGHQDVLSRLWFPNADVRIDSGHLHYLNQPAVAEFCQQFIAGENL